MLLVKYLIKWSKWGKHKAQVRIIEIHVTTVLRVNQKAHFHVFPSANQVLRASTVVLYLRFYVEMNNEELRGRVHKKKEIKE